MKALVLAGGKGTRLRPITHTSAKQLVPVANKPILFYGLESIVDAGITEIGIIVGDTREEVMDKCGDGSQFGAKITYIPQDEPLGLAHTVLIARDFLADDPFVMFLGDNLIPDGIGDFVDEFLEHGPTAQILLSHEENANQFGVAEFDDEGTLIRLVEKPDDPPSDLALVGVYMFDSVVHEAVRAIEPSARGELEITEAIQWILDQGHVVRPHVIEGWWVDTGQVHDLLDANRFLLDRRSEKVEGTVDRTSVIVGDVVVEHGAVVENSKLVGPVVIGAGSKITGSEIGPYVAVSTDCVIAESKVSDSIIMEGCHLSGVRDVVSSLLGRNVRVGHRPTGDTVLVLGDNAEVFMP